MISGDVGAVDTGGGRTGGGGGSDMLRGDVTLELRGEAILGEELPMEELGEDMEEPSGVVGEAMEEPAVEETDTFNPFIFSSPFFLIPACFWNMFSSSMLENIPCISAGTPTVFAAVMSDFSSSRSRFSLARLF